MPCLTFITTAGTIFQRVDKCTGQMVIGAGLNDVLTPQWLSGRDIVTSHIDLAVRSGAELTFATICACRDAVVAGLEQEQQAQPSAHANPCRAYVVVTGTDTLEEFAFSLQLLLGPLLVGRSASLVVTGAMKPYDIVGYDGVANVQQAVQVRKACVMLGYTSETHAHNSPSQKQA